MLNATPLHTPPHPSCLEVEGVEFSEAPAPRQALPAVTGLVRLKDAGRERVTGADFGGGRRIARGVGRAAGHFATTFALGVAVFLAWPVGDAARVVIADAAPQLWLVVGHDRGIAAAVAVPAAGPAVAGPKPPGPQRSDLAAVRDRIGRLAASAEAMTRAVADLTAGQARLEQEVARVREVEAQLVRKPVVTTKASETKGSATRTSRTKTSPTRTSPAKASVTGGEVPLAEPRPARLRQAAR